MPPKEIYIHAHKDDGYYISEWSEVSREHPDFDNIKYLRADLVVEKEKLIGLLNGMSESVGPIGQIFIEDVLNKINEL